MSRDSAPGFVRFGVFEFETRSGELHKNGSKLRIEGQPLQILAMLLDRPGQIVTREELQQTLWSADTFVSFEQGINTGIRRLREVLDDSAQTPRYIETLPRRGYRFIYPMNGKAVASESPIKKRNLQMMLAAGLAVLAVGATVPSIPAVRDRLFGPRLHISSIAVLPLENLTGDTEQEYVIDGLHDELITELAQMDLQVPSRTTVRRYKGKSENLTQIARELGRSLVAVKVKRFKHLWARSFERDERDLQSLPADIVVTVAKRILLRLTREQEVRLLNRKGIDPEAYKSVLKGNYYRAKWNRENLEKAIDYYRQALDLDPTYAPAWTGVGESYNRLGSMLMLPPREAFPRAEAAIQKALELDPSLAEAHKTLGQIKLEYDKDWDGAEKEAAIAKNLDPKWDGDSLTPIARGNFDEGIRIASAAAQHKPFGPANLVLGWAYFEAGRYDESIAQLKKTIELDRTSSLPYTELSWNYVKKGMYKEAIASCEQGMELRHKQAGNELGPGEFRCEWVYAASGRRAEALAILRENEKLPGKISLNPGYGAMAWDAMGDHERGLQLLLKAEEAGIPLTLFYVCRMCSDKLWADPRFQQLRQRIGPPEAREAPETRTARLGLKPPRL